MCACTTGNTVRSSHINSSVVNVFIFLMEPQQHSGFQGTKTLQVFTPLTHRPPIPRLFHSLKGNDGVLRLCVAMATVASRRACELRPRFEASRRVRGKSPLGRSRRVVGGGGGKTKRTMRRDRSSRRGNEGLTRFGLLSSEASTRREQHNTMNSFHVNYASKWLRVT